MFTVKTPEEVLTILREEFSELSGSEQIPAAHCCGRVLSEDIFSGEYVPDFSRSTVDGYAVQAKSTFGCSDSIPAIFPVIGEINMGQPSGLRLEGDACVYVPTGGAVPVGADAVVMIEYTEDYGDGTIGVLKPASPGMNVIYRGDDVFPGKTVLRKGRKLTVTDIGALSAMGRTTVPVVRKPLVGIISTGDELVPVEEIPPEGCVRDVNSSMLDAMCRELGADTILFGIVPDEGSRLAEVLSSASGKCDLVLISGGSSVGTRDVTLKMIEASGEILFHGIAMKPGKPTILGKVSGTPVFGLPGHPVAAFFVAWIFVRYLLAVMTGRTIHNRTMPARLTEAISANHGRTEYLGVRLCYEQNPFDAEMLEQTLPLAEPIHTKSGLISALAGSDGYFCIPRDCEGRSAGEIVGISFYSIE